MPISNPALGEIVGGKLHRHAVSGENPDTIAPKFSGQVGKNGAVGIKLDTKQTTRELFDYGPGHFNTIFFAHLPLKLWVWAKLLHFATQLYFTAPDSVLRSIRRGVEQPTPA